MGRAYAENLFKKLTGTNPVYSLINKKGKTARFELHSKDYDHLGDLEDTSAMAVVTLTKTWTWGQIEGSGAYVEPTKQNNYTDKILTSKLKDFTPEGPLGALRIKSCFGYPYDLDATEYNDGLSSIAILGINAQNPKKEAIVEIKRLIDSCDALIGYFGPKDGRFSDEAETFEDIIDQVKSIKMGRTVMQKEFNKYTFNFMYRPPTTIRTTSSFGNSSDKSHKLELDAHIKYFTNHEGALLQVQKSLWGKVLE